MGHTHAVYKKIKTDSPAPDPARGYLHNGHMLIGLGQKNLSFVIHNSKGGFSKC